MSEVGGRATGAPGDGARRPADGRLRRGGGAAAAAAAGGRGGRWRRRRSCAGCRCGRGRACPSLGDAACGRGRPLPPDGARGARIVSLLVLRLLSARRTCSAGELTCMKSEAEAREPGVEAGQPPGRQPRAREAVAGHDAGGRALGARRRRVRAAGEAPGRGRGGRGGRASRSEALNGPVVGRGEEQEDGGGEVGAVELGGGARGDRLAGEVGGEERMPLVAAVDAGGADRGAARGRGRVSASSLICAVERVGGGRVGLAQGLAAAVVAVDGARGEEDDAGVAGGVEQAQGAVAVQAAEAGGVVALAAAVGAGDVGEREVDEGVGRRQARRRVGEGPADVAGAAEGGDAVAGGARGRGRRSGRRCRWRR